MIDLRLQHRPDGWCQPVFGLSLVWFILVGREAFIVVDFRIGGVRSEL